MIHSENCCGCGACALVCAKNAIELCPDEKGFLSPKIDKTLCVCCGLCDSVCPEQNTPVLKPEKTVYAMKAEKKIRRDSQSGGAFALLAENFLKKGGLVYGAALLEDVSVGYVRISEIEELKKLKTSKYVQADNRRVYKSVLEDLLAGKEVLYAGTPCYVSGLYRFLEIKKCPLDRIYTIDLVCHGVPSPKLYKEYIAMECKISGRNAKSFVFRDKAWSLNEKYSKIIWDAQNATLVNGYLRMFSTRLAYRPSCLSCKYACRDRVGDITLGDFWGVELLHPDFDDNRGVSLVIANTDKGESLLSLVLEETRNIMASKDDAVKKQPSMRSPGGKPEEYDAFWAIYAKEGLEAAMLAFCDFATSSRVALKKNRIKTYDKRFLYSHVRGKLKMAVPSFLRGFLRKVVKR